MSYFRSSVDQMTGYLPGEQPKPETPIITIGTDAQNQTLVKTLVVIAKRPY
ncbi:MAG: hypothetical protein K6T90_01635 [Leptolyngbyaceae cyanobacterium HOT.MB2.61]|jgi:hypothetical protein|nr:hypothetical protein [Leptolyngbyaceae cyanobacterium HOT.MB2.61]